MNKLSCNFCKKEIKGLDSIGIVEIKDYLSIKVTDFNVLYFKGLWCNTKCLIKEINKRIKTFKKENKK
jgi:hypothetical protein